jgi:hypothetical protein
MHTVGAEELRVFKLQTYGLEVHLFEKRLKGGVYYVVSFLNFIVAGHIKP